MRAWGTVDWGALAACFLDSLATMNLPAVGYGLRYDFGIFKQRIVNGYQMEQPDEWLKLGIRGKSPIPSSPSRCSLKAVWILCGDQTAKKWRWLDTKTVIGMPYDLPVVGYGGNTVNTLSSGRPRLPRSSTWMTSTAANTWTRWPTSPG